MLLLGIGVGFAFAAMAALVTEGVPVTETGVATGVNTVMRTVGAVTEARSWPRSSPRTRFPERRFHPKARSPSLSCSQPERRRSGRCWACSSLRSEGSENTPPHWRSTKVSASRQAIALAGAVEQLLTALVSQRRVLGRRAESALDLSSKLRSGSWSTLVQCASAHLRTRCARRTPRRRAQSTCWRLTNSHVANPILLTHAASLSAPPSPGRRGRPPPSPARAAPRGARRGHESPRG